MNIKSFLSQRQKSINQTDWRKCSAKQTSESELPVLISPSFKKLLHEIEKEAIKKPERLKDLKALRLQLEFSEKEKNAALYETSDPLGEQKYCITPYLVHQYENRVLLLTTGKCLSYCRYCFRRGFTSRNHGFINENELKTVCNYIEKNPKITEILVSGGDPLSGGYKNIKRVLCALRAVRQNLIIRLCTRAPVFAPEVFTPGLLRLLKQSKPLWLIPHINHPAELGSGQKKALLDCIDSGIPVQSQTVLLKNINDDETTLVILFHTLTCMGIKPGYLFQLDAAAGTSHFRVPLKDALTLWKTLEKRLSGLSRPQFSADLPEGGGKFPLSALVAMEKIVEKNGLSSFSALGTDGVIHKYTL
ncbi:MAG: 4Fe-4S cluster-binding domain-containing protein [Treponema pedis]|nr:radical SAM protein [Treponema pedis]